MPPRVTDIKDDSPEEKPPQKPSAARTKTSTTGTGKRRTPNDKKLGEAIAGMYAVAGATITGIGMRIGDQGITATGVKTMELTEELSEAWLDLADKNPKVKQTLLKLTEISSTGVLVGLHFSIALPLLADRGIVPAQFAAAAGAAATAETNGNGSTT